MYDATALMPGSPSAHGNQQWDISLCILAFGGSLKEVGQESKLP